MDTRTVFALRKEGKVQEALDMALKLYENDPQDSWTQSALAWPLIDLCKAALKESSLITAQKYFSQLIAINFTDIDDIVKSQIAFLRPKIDINYTHIQAAENLSKNGNHKQALINMKAMFANNQLLDIHHEAYGWVIYRYIKEEENNVTSFEIRSLLRDYMNLKNERPSIVHSVFLNFALHYSKNHTDFNLYNFFLLWEPKNLRYEDLHGKFSITELMGIEKGYPSLISRILKELIEKNLIRDCNEIIQRIPDITTENKLELLRKPFYYKIYKADKENRKEDVWKTLEEYNSFFINQSGSETHSRILNTAMFSMKENEEWRFLNFFENWNPENFIESDWKEVEVQNKTGKSFNLPNLQNIFYSENQPPSYINLNVEIQKNTDFPENIKKQKTYQPIALKALKKAFELIKVSKQFPVLTKFIKAYKLAVLKFPKDVWLKREYATLLSKNNQNQEAIKIYKKLVLELGDQSYVWHEFSLLFNDEHLELAIGMLSKAIKLQKEESFLGTTRLDLADKFIKCNKLEEAKIELNKYQEYRVANNKNVAEKFNVLAIFVKETQIQKKDNLEIYYNSIIQAESFAYQDIKWSELVFIEKWKSDKNKEKLSFSDGNILNISINTHRFPLLKNIEVGQIIKFKLHNKLVEDKTKLHHFKQEYFPLLVEISDNPKWSCLEEIIAYIDYINVDKMIVHAITNENKEVFFPVVNINLTSGDFVTARKFQKTIREEIRIELKDVSKINKAEVIQNFSSYLAVVDSVNNDKELFHYVVNSRIQGIIRFNETELRPLEGDFIQIRLINKLDKKLNKLIYKTIEINLTEESTNVLRKEISGFLKLKYRLYGSTLDREDFTNLDSEHFDSKDVDFSKPDFGFVGDYYVPKEVLQKSEIGNNCDVEAKVIFNGKKWKVYDFKKRITD